MTTRQLVALALLTITTAVASAQAPATGSQPAAPPGTSVLAGEGAEAGAGRLPDSLDGMLAIALRTNPEVLQAEAKLNRAQADLNQARLKVIREVITSFHERKKLEQSADIQASQLSRVKQLIATGQAPTDEANASRLALTEAQARLAQIDAQIRYMLGTEGGTGLGGRKDPPVASAQPPATGQPAARRRPAIPDKMEKILAQRITLRLQGEAETMRRACELLSHSFGGQTFVVDESASAMMENGIQAPVELKDVPLRDALLALADLFKVCFVFRDYGVLMVSPEAAQYYYSPAIPPEAPLADTGR